MAKCEHLFLGKCMISAKPAGEKVPSQCGKSESHLANWWSRPFTSWDARVCTAADSEEQQRQCSGFNPTLDEEGIAEMRKVIDKFLK